MNPLIEKRYRINATQTAKGLWYFDATIEVNEDHVTISPDTDKGDVKSIPLGEKLLSIIQETEKAFKADGRKMVGALDE